MWENISILCDLFAFRASAFDSGHRLYFVPKRVVAGLVGVLRNGGGLGMGSTYIPLVFFHSLLYRSSRFTYVNFAGIAELHTKKGR